MTYTRFLSNPRDHGVDMGDTGAILLLGSPIFPWDGDGKAHLGQLIRDPVRGNVAVLSLPRRGLLQNYEFHLRPIKLISWALKQKTRIITEAVSALLRVWPGSLSPKSSHLPMVTINPECMKRLGGVMRVCMLICVHTQTRAGVKQESNIEINLLDVKIMSRMS